MSTDRPLGDRTERVDITDGNQDPHSLIAHLARYAAVLRQISENDRVVEVGCGTGYGTHLLGTSGAEVIGYDPYVSADALNGKWSRANVSFVDSLEQIKDFSVVVALEVIEHMERADADTFLRDLLKLGGAQSRWFISTPRKLPYDELTPNRRRAHPYEYGYVEFREVLQNHFKHVHLFSQNDGLISSQNPRMAWNFFAICTI